MKGKNEENVLVKRERKGNGKKKGKGCVSEKGEEGKERKGK